jgi:hypothetical protein
MDTYKSSPSNLAQETVTESRNKGCDGKKTVIASLPSDPPNGGKCSDITVNTTSAMQDWQPPTIIEIPTVHRQGRMKTKEKQRNRDGCQQTP